MAMKWDGTGTGWDGCVSGALCWAGHGFDIFFSFCFHFSPLTLSCPL